MPEQLPFQPVGLGGEEFDQLALLKQVYNPSIEPGDLPQEIMFDLVVAAAELRYGRLPSGNMSPARRTEPAHVAPQEPVDPEESVRWVTFALSATSFLTVFPLATVYSGSVNVGLLWTSGLISVFTAVGAWALNEQES